MRMIHINVQRATALCMQAVLVAGCASTPSTPGNTSFDRPAAVSVTAGFDWDWDVTGDQAVRPIQVFSNGEKTYLQVAQHQLMPALIVDGKPVGFDVAPPYFVLQGKPVRIDLVAKNFRAVVTKRTSTTPSVTHTGTAKPEIATIDLAGQGSTANRIEIISEPK